jgi:cytochrome P450
MPMEPIPGIGEIRTPASRASLLQPGPAGVAAWLGARLLSKPLRLGKTVLAARHRDVSEVLRRDLDFRIAPVNAGRIEQVNGPFVLGMDRGARLTAERGTLYSALAAVDLPKIVEASASDADALIRDAADDRIDAVAGYGRLVAGRTAMRLFGINPPDEAAFLEVARSVFAHTFLNLGGDPRIEGRALKAATLMRAWLTDEIARRRAAGVTGDDYMGALMRQTADDDLVRRTLGGMLVGSVDTTASSVARILVMMGRDQGLLQAASRDAGDHARLLGWCREALRRWPHNPIVLRRTTEATALNGVTVPAGAQVFAWTQAAMQDPAAFPAPGQMIPDRPAEGYLHFGGGLHPCAGRMVNDLQIPMLVSKLLIRGVARVGRVSWAGPFPDRLPLKLRRSA